MKNGEYIASLTEEEAKAEFPNNCYMCVFEGKDCVAHAEMRCSTGIREFLRSERKEPYSWEKLLAELDSGMFHWTNNEGEEITTVCFGPFSAIASCIRALRGE